MLTITSLRPFSRHFAAATLMGASVLGMVLTANPAQALSWIVDTGTQTETGLSISGAFTIDAELADSPLLTFSNISIDGNVFTASNLLLLSNTPGVGVTAIDWQDTDFNRLSFVFDSPLTPSGGTVVLDDNVSSYVPFNPGLPLSVSGSVSQVPEPLTLLGAGTAIALGGLFKRRRG